jgi:Na+/melibiose symporter-like transporter
MAFFTISLAWTIYNAFVPIFLIGNEQISGLIKSSTVMGLIIVLDNIFGLLFQPFFGRLSDKTKTRFGRRMPFMLIGVPLAALFFILIPFYNTLGRLFPFDLRLVFLMMFVIGMNFFMSIYRAPAVALMPDATPAPLRSSANGIITAMGGLATIVAFLAGGKLFNLNPIYPFLMGGGMMIIALLLLIFFYKEPEVPYSADDEDAPKADTGLFWGRNGQKSAIAKNPSVLHMLMTVFFWFCGFECLNAFFTLYAEEKYGMIAGDATQMLAPLVVVFMICALPAGLIGSKIGRKTSMLVGNIIIITTFVIIFLLNDRTYMPLVMCISGIGWSLMTTNAYPAVAEMAPNGQTGRYTGYYFVFTSAASIASPILYGLTVDVMGSQTYLFLFGSVMFTLGLLFLVNVKKKDASHFDQSLVQPKQDQQAVI